MNGYAIITFSGYNIPDGYNVSYESTLSPKSYPEPQSIQNLRDCSYSIRDCLQYTECYRDYETTDSDNDFYQFVDGINYIIYAYGDQSGDSSWPIRKHDHGNANGGGDVFMYMNGENICYTTSGESLEEGEDDETDKIWMIVGIIFIILFGIAFLWILYSVYKSKKTPGSGYIMNRIGSADRVDDNEMANINTGQTETSPMNEDNENDENNDLAHL